MSKTGPWVGFDLDGTIAHYGDWRGPHHIGAPIKPMCDLLKSFIERGCRVKIFTARVGPHGTNYADGRPIDPEYTTKARTAIEDWCQEQFGQVLEITHEKDFEMLFCFDDRAVSVQENIGVIVSDISKMPCLAHIK